jgi:hypothetical protein
VGGTLQVDFSNYTPTSTGSWDLITAPIISGSFDALEVVGNPGLALGEALSLRTVDMASDVLQLFVEQRLVLNVDRQSGNISITNPAGTPIPFDGYSIRSENGALDPNEWNSLQTQIGSGWTEANPDTDKLNEFRTTGVQNLGPQLLDLGDIFASPVPTEFGVEADDLVFTYSSPDRPQVEGIINYTGGSLNNNLVIYADPATGEVALQNASPFNVVLDAYTIVSGDNELRPGNGNWDSLDDQGVDGPDWQEANVGTGRVTEFNTGAGTLLSPNEAYELGELYTIGGSESLLFEFILANEDFTRTGNIVYGPAPIVGDLVGDYNQDGVVNAADYVVWRNNEGTNNVLPNDEIGGTIGAAQFNQWVDNFGNGLNNGAGSGAGAVPEPASGLLMACAITALAATRRHSPAILVGNLKQNPPGWRTQWNPPGWRGYGIG